MRNSLNELKDLLHHRAFSDELGESAPGCWLGRLLSKKASHALLHFNLLFEGAELCDILKQKVPPGHVAEFVVERLLVKDNTPHEIPRRVVQLELSLSGGW